MQMMDQSNENNYSQQKESQQQPQPEQQTAQDNSVPTETPNNNLGQDDNAEGGQVSSGQIMKEETQDNDELKDEE